MAVLEIEVAAEEQARAQREAEQAGLSLSEWAKRRLFGSPLVTFTTDDGEVYEIPDLPDPLSDDVLQAALRQLMRERGQRTSPRKAAASAANGRRNVAQPLDALPCTCQPPRDTLAGHSSLCPRGRAIKRRGLLTLPLTDPNLHGRL